jgi:hypothetical protein
MSDEEDINKMLEDLAEEAGKDVQKNEDSEDPTDREELAKNLLEMTQSDRKMADKIFQLFYPNIGSGTDRSQASKEALTRALELKINAGRNIIDLMKLLKEDQNSGNVGIFISDKKAGIDMKNIQEGLDDDD